MNCLKIKNWKEFQHFKDRNPPWIKLHKNILEQRDIMMISDCSFRILIGLWLLASEDKDKQGALPSIKDMAFRLRKTEKEIIHAIKELSQFLIHDDITMISERYHRDDPETETETETETYSKETESILSDFEGFWNLYGFKVGKQKAQISYNNARKKGVTHETIIGGVERYQRASQAKGTPAKFIKHPATWLNGEHWNDEYPEYTDNRSDTKQTGDTNRNRALSALFNA